jgi:hypothetical protein
MAKRLRENRYVSYPRKSSLNNPLVGVLSVLLLGSILLISIFFINISTLSQKLRIEKSDLSHTIPELAVLAMENGTTFPEGVSRAVQKNSKDKIKYGTILLGKCNSYFSKKTGRTVYEKAHPQDVLWIEYLGQGDLRILRAF